VFRKTESTAGAIANPQAHAPEPIRSTETLHTLERLDTREAHDKPLSFEEQLFTAPVYKRTFRPKGLERILHQSRRARSSSVGPSEKNPSDNDPKSPVSPVRPAKTWGTSPYPSKISAPDHSSQTDLTSPFDSPLLRSQSYDVTKSYDVPKHKHPPSIAHTLPEVNQELYEPFYKACHKGDLVLVEQSLDQNIDVHRHSPGFSPAIAGPSPIHIAASTGNVELAKVLLRYGARVNEKYEADQTPLHDAAFNNQPQMVSFLLDSAAKPDSRDVSGYQPIHFACQKGNLEITNSLIKAGASVSCAANDGYTPLHFAVRDTENMELIDLLIQSGAELEALTRPTLGFLKLTPLGLACRRNKTKAIQKLISYGSRLDFGSPWHQRPFIAALRTQKRSLLENLRDQGVNVLRIDPLSGSTALHTLVEVDKPDLDVVRLLVSWGIDVKAQNKNGEQALHLATNHPNQVHLLELLLELGADVNLIDNFGASAFDWAVMRMGAITPETFLKHGSIVGLETFAPSFSRSHSYTPDSDSESQSTHCEQMIALFLKHGADINARDADGTTALHRATVHCDSPAVQLLLNQGADVKISDHYGRSAHHYAAKSSERHKTLSLLLDSGADVNAIDKDGKPALYFAVERLDMVATKTLLEHGATVKQAGEENSPYEILEHKKFNKGFVEMRNLLDKHMIQQRKESFERERVEGGLNPDLEKARRAYRNTPVHWDGVAFSCV
jgi:ankyrin repeat protein